MKRAAAWLQVGSNLNVSGSPSYSNARVPPAAGRKTKFVITRTPTLAKRGLKEKDEYADWIGASNKTSSEAWSCSRSVSGAKWSRVTCSSASAKVRNEESGIREMRTTSTRGSGRG